MLNKWIDYLIRLILITLAIIWFFLLYSDSSLLVLLAIILLIGTTIYLIMKEQSDLTSNMHNIRKKFLNELHIKK
ncbi:hypothetical protein [Companilactobacillus ginsenosidimutans]|uniref:Uncharacterized protein n=1 Tax=Companilactobacillus ginsenosidimutans TaxID=1007676 RepID=A0A0H4R0M0_9LACO|nr:hypothetical protein [Companilactobacillus ginsenosidimutans]AKP67275.1 hypothetical protein ABM34_06795 [Companilactobacillus ginsenosidimutans]